MLPIATHENEVGMEQSIDISAELFRIYPL